eukprot:14015396-Ditylum_brightwellii.AAC.2
MSSSAVCPDCNAGTKCKVHLFQCKAPVVVAARTATVVKLKSVLYDHCTAPIIKEVILHKVSQYYSLPYKLPQIPTDAIGQRL